MSPAPLRKYPRTRHLMGSRLQPGDEDLSAAPFSELEGRPLVVEEKLDGANAAVSFDEDGKPWLQSRGHYLTGGHRERHFDLLKTWAMCHRDALFTALGSRYVMYGEWLYAKHTVFYDRLPHYFMEFDVLDRQSGAFLSTARRRELLQDAPVWSVPVLHEGTAPSIEALAERVAPSLYKSEDWQDALRRAAADEALDVERVVLQTDPSSLAEGLYVKVEEDGEVTGRFKWVRHSFLTSVVDSGGHWIDRPIVPNRLAPEVDLYDPRPPREQRA
ncbi:RNA ligase family protein [Paraliomyxa miuraensis]|uniref:RNA ligase family protein n=1 Tax=Paraliomyxa miuraensis TaxID=376150 RepID=UPI002259A9F1|nr:RNA ligase family protein [Paraliomyxa miuraensis]MCX4240755.1 RNA ligase family protein [Paraliomyxa miuraensis]